MLYCFPPKLARHRHFYVHYKYIQIPVKVSCVSIGDQPSFEYLPFLLQVLPTMSAY